MNPETLLTLNFIFAALIAVLTSILAVFVPKWFKKVTNENKDIKDNVDKIHVVINSRLTELLNMKDEVSAIKQALGKAEGKAEAILEAKAELKQDIKEVSKDVKADTIIVTTESAKVSAANVVVEHNKDKKT